MAVNPSSAFDNLTSALWGGSQITQHPATGPFYHHPFSTPYPNIHQRGSINPDGHYSAIQHQQQLQQISPTNQQHPSQHSQQQLQKPPVSPIVSYSTTPQPTISPNGGNNVSTNVVPQPAPSSSSHSSESVNSPPPSFSVFQSLMDQSLFFQQQNYQNVLTKELIVEKCKK